MKTGSPAAAAVIALGFLTETLALYDATSANPVVRTSYGHVKGTASAYREGVSVFKGIRYAQPPVGELRWKPPTKPAPWNGVYDATQFGSQCPQSLALGKSIWTTGNSQMSEDCLFLNVWTTNLNSTEKQPVYIWMHGGRFMDGSGDVVTFDGSGLAVHDIVVVTINDRLGEHTLTSGDQDSLFLRYGFVTNSSHGFSAQGRLATSRTLSCRPSLPTM